jgi:hypothetical protein
LQIDNEQKTTTYSSFFLGESDTIKVNMQIVISFAVVFLHFLPFLPEELFFIISKSPRTNLIIILDNQLQSGRLLIRVVFFKIRTGIQSSLRKDVLTKTPVQ